MPVISECNQANSKDTGDAILLGALFAQYICYTLGNLALEAVKNKSVDYGQ